MLITYLDQFPYGLMNPLFRMMPYTMSYQMPERKIGKYTLSQRRAKIQKYKFRIQKYREDHPIKRNYNGRSRVAKTKPRMNGKFAKNIKIDNAKHEEK
mgnify:CR=1 FL=1